METSQYVETLIDLGLTKLEARIYLTIYFEGSSNATTIAKIAKVSRPDIYRIMYRLQKLGLVEKEISYPNKFTAIPIQITIEVLLKQKTKELADLRSKSDFLRESLKGQVFPKNLVPESKFILIPSKKSLIKKLRSAIENTENTIDIATSSKRFFFACSTFSKTVNKAWLRGVNGRVIIESIEESLLDLVKDTWKTPFAEIKYLPTIPKTVMAIYDKKQVFIFVERYANLEDSAALWSNNSNLVSMANDFFEILWITALDPHYKIHQKQK